MANRCLLALWDGVGGFGDSLIAMGGSAPPLLLFCPTEYCGRIAQPGTVGSGCVAPLHCFAHHRMFTVCIPTAVRRDER